MNKRCAFPNFLTAANLFCGFLAVTFVVQAIEVGTDGAAWFRWAAIAICFSALCDALDGRVARALHVSSPFGKELDSLADVVSFGVAPALLVYEGFFRDYPSTPLWMAISGLFVCCGAARLARYNVSGSAGSFFTGMPIPAAGLTITGLAMFPAHFDANLMAGVVLMGALLMVSTVRFPNPEHVVFDSPVLIRVMLVSLFVVALIDPHSWFFLLPVAYTLYSLGANLIDVLRPNEA